MNVPRKWRPSLALLITCVVGFLVALPFAALIVARVTSTQFVQETEASLHAQAAIYAAQYAQTFGGIAEDGAQVPDDVALSLAKDFAPPPLRVTAHSDAILPPRPDPIETGPTVRLSDLSALAYSARRSTLVGMIAMDHTGTIIAASGTDAGSLAHVPEVARALSGYVTSVARWRTEEYRNHSLRSLSRDTKFRVFVAHPVIVGDRVVGAIYLSRTPSNLNKYLFQQRHTLAWLGAALVLATMVVGVFLWRLLTRPLHRLTEQAAQIAHGAEPNALRRYGVREIAQLGQSLMDMGATLRQRSSQLETYTKHATHELKSPVTSIAAAAELLENADVPDARRLTLARTIKADAARMDHLLLRMRDMVKGQIGFDATPVTLAEACDGHEMLHAVGDVDRPLPLPRDAFQLCLTHLVQNAVEHGATRINASYDHGLQRIALADDGEGLAPGNAEKALEPFFTTKRSSGGTGLGLSICAEVVGQYGGQLQITNGPIGATITLSFKH